MSFVDDMINSFSTCSNIHSHHSLFSIKIYLLLWRKKHNSSCVWIRRSAHKKKLNIVESSISLTCTFYFIDEVSCWLLPFNFVNFLRFFLCINLWLHDFILEPSLIETEEKSKMLESYVKSMWSKHSDKKQKNFTKIAILFNSNEKNIDCNSMLI